MEPVLLPEPHIVVPCPKCGQPSDSIKCYTLLTIIFLFIVGVSQTQKAIGCPGCVRKSIALSGLVNMLTANILWPFIILPYCIILLICSFTQGHSRDILNALSE
jgi:hypothetical protein